MGRKASPFDRLHSPPRRRCTLLGLAGQPGFLPTLSRSLFHSPAPGSLERRGRQLQERHLLLLFFAQQPARARFLGRKQTRLPLRRKRASEARRPRVCLFGAGDVRRDSRSLRRKRAGVRSGLAAGSAGRGRGLVRAVSLRERPEGGRSRSGVRQAASRRAVAKRFLSGWSSSRSRSEKKKRSGGGGTLYLGASSGSSERRQPAELCGAPAAPMRLPSAGSAR